MANNNSNSSQINVPEAREAMRNMKHEVANELGITLNQGYNGNISAKDAGHIGGNMVKNVLPVRPRKKARKSGTGGAQNAAVPALLRPKPGGNAPKSGGGNMLPARPGAALSRRDGDENGAAHYLLALAREHRKTCEGRFLHGKLGALELRARIVV